MDKKRAEGDKKDKERANITQINQPTCTQY